MVLALFVPGTNYPEDYVSSSGMQLHLPGNCCGNKKRTGVSLVRLTMHR